MCGRSPPAAAWMSAVAAGRQPRGGSWPWKARVLVAIEEIEDRPRHADQALEVADSGGTHVDTAEAAKGGDHIADTGATAAEAERTATNAAEQVEVPDFAPFQNGAGGAVHGLTPWGWAAGGRACAFAQPGGGRSRGG